MKIAIFNGFAFHYEMFGYIIDYCLSKNIELDIYTVNVYDINWLEYYNLFFHKNINYYPINRFNYIINDYNVVILTTDDEKLYNIELNKNKLICIDHCYNNRRPYVPIHIGTRFYHTRPDLDYALPVYRIMRLQNKKELLKNVKQTNILCIGKYNCQDTIDTLKKRFNNFNELNFIFIDRYLNDFCTLDEPNIKKYNRLNTVNMIGLLAQSHYVYISMVHLDHIAKSMSGAIPLAFNCLCQLIMPKEMNKYYNFKSAITYTKNESITLSTYDCDIVDVELEELLYHKYKIFDKYITE